MREQERPAVVECASCDPAPLFGQDANGVDRDASKRKAQPLRGVPGGREATRGHSPRTKPAPSRCCVERSNVTDGRSNAIYHRPPDSLDSFAELDRVVILGCRHASRGGQASFHQPLPKGGAIGDAFHRIRGAPPTERSDEVERQRPAVKAVRAALRHGCPADATRCNGAPASAPRNRNRRREHRRRERSFRREPRQGDRTTHGTCIR